MPGMQTLSNQTLGHYQILREAGRGGMSMVYEAMDTRIGRRVALKVLSLPMSLSPEMQSAMLTRLNREARAIARLSHPNIVAIYDIGEQNGQHFIVMEYLEGLTLRQRMDEGPIPEREAATILDQVAAGLDAVHTAGIVHRDIKPSNVMLLPSGQVKLMDFGVARQSEDTLVTQAGTMVGSPVYMSPEQINGDLCGPPSDLWSLGIVLYEMLAGSPPFTGSNIPNVVYQVTHRSPAPLPRATRAVQRVLTRALDKDPTQRYGSAHTLAAAFRAALVLPAVLSERPLPTAPRLPAMPPTSVSHRARLPLLPRPIAWAAALLLLTLLAALPAALHPRRAPQVQVLNQPSLPLRPAALPQPKPKTAVFIAAMPRPRIVTKPAPVVRVASARQEWIRRTPQGKIGMAPHPKVRRRHNAPLSPRAPESPRIAARPQVTPRARRHRALHALPFREARQPPARLPTAAPVTEAPSPPLPPLASPVPPVSRAEAGPNLLGTWHGKHSHNPATLTITHRDGNAFAGTMSVRTPEAEVRIAVEGHVSPRTGEVSMRERRILSSSKPRAWDLGSESGHIAANGKIAGTGTDVKGRYGAWSFSR